MRKILILTLGVIITMTLSTSGHSQDITLQKRDGKAFFELLSLDTMYLVDQFYAKDTKFKDPVVEFDNREDLKHYYASAYGGTESVTFEIPEVINQGNSQVIIWVMTMKAKKLNKGRPIIVEGSSLIHYNENGQAIFHQDYFDMGEMIYSHVPFVRGMVKFVDKRMRKKHDQSY